MRRCGPFHVCCDVLRASDRGLRGRAWIRRVCTPAHKAPALQPRMRWRCVIAGGRRSSRAALGGLSAARRRTLFPDLARIKAARPGAPYSQSAMARAHAHTHEPCPNSAPPGPSLPVTRRNDHAGRPACSWVTLSRCMTVTAACQGGTTSLPARGLRLCPALLGLVGGAGGGYPGGYRRAWNIISTGVTECRQGDGTATSYGRGIRVKPAAM